MLTCTSTQRRALWSRFASADASPCAMSLLCGTQSRVGAQGCRPCLAVTKPAEPPAGKPATLAHMEEGEEKEAKAERDAERGTPRIGLSALVCTSLRPTPTRMQVLDGVSRSKRQGPFSPASRANATATLPASSTARIERLATPVQSKREALAAAARSLRLATELSHCTFTPTLVAKFNGESEGHLVSCHLWHR